MNTSKEAQLLGKWTVRDIVFMAIIAAVVGVVNIGLGTVYVSVEAALGPLGAALMNGTYTWGFLLAYYFIRKPGCMLIVGVLEATLGALLGAPSGIYTLGWGVTEGLGAEIVMAMAGPNKIKPAVFALAGAASVQLPQVWTWYLFGWHDTMTMFWISLPITMVSGAIFSGLLGYWLARIVHRTGMIHPSDDL